MSQAGLPTDLPALQASIAHQRESLKELLQQPLAEMAQRCAGVWPKRDELNQLCLEGLKTFPYCMFMYVLDKQAVQISDNASQYGLQTEHLARDRSQRPYVLDMNPDRDFNLSGSYISLHARRPSITAMQSIRDNAGELLGYLGADFDLRDLPLSSEVYEEPVGWRQMKGDPAIRGGVFAQTRSESLMDQHMDTSLAIMEEMILERGVFHGKLHFSSSRMTIWLYDDPYRYRILEFDALQNPDVCLAYPHREYPKGSLIPEEAVRPILEQFRALRFADDTVYLRSGSLNLFNGVVSLTFSCDGSHYVSYDTFLNKGLSFWIGSDGQLP
ncbi:MAG TPA: hypothetical protein ENI64_13580 [Gammaproteobacteria bacterium]|nr:hypothetical protein [Gammaproteobacteria bacterium]